MSREQLQRIFKPQRIALIGASDDPQSLGANLTGQALGLAGLEVLLVNRRRSEIYGQPVLPEVSALPDGVDLAVVMTPWASVPGMVSVLSQKRCAGVVVMSLAQEGGVLWDSSRMLLYRLRRQLRRSAIRIIGPASQGLLLPKLRLNLSLCAKLAPAGHIAFLAGSAAVTDFFADWAAMHGIGASLIVGMGDEVDLDTAQCLDYLAFDPDTRAVLVYLDRMPDPRRWLSAARALSARKPLVVLIDPGFASSGGAADLDQLQLLKQALERAGALVVADLEELCAAANVDLPAWPHAGSRFAVLGNTPALGALAARAVERSGGLLARFERSTERALRPLLPAGPVRNPVDLLRNADGPRYAAAIAAVRADPGVDVILAVHHSNAFAAGAQIATALAPSPDGSPPLLLSFIGGAPRKVRQDLAQQGIAAFATPESAVAAYALNRRYFQLRHQLRMTPPPLTEPEQPVPEVLALIRSVEISHNERLQLLLKALEIDLHPQTAGAQAGITIGVRCDPRLGPLAWLRTPAGMLRTELLPLDRLRVAALVNVPESASTSDAEFQALLRHALLRLALVFPVLPELTAVRLLDLYRDAEGALAGRAELEWDFDARRPAFAFAPAPTGLNEVIRARDGQEMLLRPIRAEDEPRLATGFTKLSPEEVRMRFMFPLKQLTHELGARLTQLDYDREVALVLSGFEPPGQAELYAVVRASVDVLENSAEFAIVIPRQLSGQGLGMLLLGRIVEWCRQRRLRSVWGDVLAENQAMLGLARKLGFAENSHPDQASLVRVELLLR